MFFVICNALDAWSESNRAYMIMSSHFARTSCFELEKVLEAVQVASMSTLINVGRREG